MMSLDMRLTRPGAQIAFADSGGDGQPVVLTHGAGMDHTMWDTQVSALRGAGYRVIVWDVRGHGASTLEPGTRFRASSVLSDLGAVLDECELRRPVLVGHSLGGNVAQAFVRQDPERVAGIIVVDSTWNAGPLSFAERLSLRIGAPALRLIPAGRLPGLMARASAVVPEAIERTDAVFRRMTKAEFIDVFGATISLVAPEPGYRSPVPLGLIRGARDQTGNIAAAMPRWAAAEGIEEHVIPDAGHVVTWDAPEATAQALLQILGGAGFR